MRRRGQDGFAGRQASIGRHRRDVPLDLDAGPPALHERCEASVVRMDREPLRRSVAVVAERVCDSRRRCDESPLRNGDAFALAPDLESQLTRQNVERIRVVAVNVRTGDLLTSR
jgi:hypothetical protein